MLIVAAVLLSRTRAALVRTTALVTVLTLVTVASFVASIIWTNQVPASAYFVTPTRMWEFGAGGLLAVSGARTPRAALGSGLSWAGLAAIGISSVLLNGRSPFPGLLALVPVLGTLAVIVAGDPQHSTSPTRLARIRPVQLLGDVSYSVYLWHWPLIVMLPLLLTRPLAAGDKIAIAAAAVVLAYGTKVVVEDPFRFSSRLVAARPRWTFAAMVTAGAVVVAGCTGSMAIMDRRIDREADRVMTATEKPCFGAAALERGNDCPDVFAVEDSMTPAFAQEDTGLIADPSGGWQCEVPAGQSAIRRCFIGEALDPERTLALLGDSRTPDVVS